MALSELLNIAKFSTGYHGDGPAAPAPDFGFLFPNQDKKQATALKLAQYQALVNKAQADAAIAQRKKQLWDSVGTPTVTDKSNAGQVADIVDTEKVGGKDADVVNSGDTWLNSETYQGQNPALLGMKSNSRTANLVQRYQPALNAQGDMVLAKKKEKSNYQGAAKRYDETKTFSYAKRLTDQAIIKNGQNRKDIDNAAYSAMIQENIPKAETYLYGKPLSEPEPKKAATATDQAGALPAAGKLPDSPKAPVYQEGQTAINRKTGKRLVFKGGQWQSLN